MTQQSKVLLALCVGWPVTTALAQGDFDDVEIIPHAVAGSVHYLEGQGGNIGLSVGDDGVLMIDDQFAPLSEKIVAAVRSISDAEIRFLINTHVHPDHTGGNENFAALGVAIIAHDNVRVRMTQGIRGGSPSPPTARPLLTFGDAISFGLNGEQIDVVKVPSAHTDGDSYIYFRNADVLHLGDVFRTTGYPFIDVDNGGSAQGTLEALQLALEMSGPNTKIVPGHGDLSTADDVREFRDMIAVVKQRVSELIEQGMTLEQVLAAAPTADFDARYGDPERFLQGLYTAIDSEGS